MAATTFPAVRVLEQFRVSPPPDSEAVVDTSIPLTFFDVSWIDVSPVERLFFYEHPLPTLHFIETILPNLKRSLSLTLQHFYPLAGILRPSPDDSTRHEIHHKAGDSVSLTLAECDGDFGELVGNQPRDVNLFLPLVPKLQRAGSTVPVMALQVTLFPNCGICIGISIHHTVCDGSGSTYFLKSWASACRSQGMASPVNPPPILDRTIISDPSGLYTTLRNAVLRFTASLQEGGPPKSIAQASTVVVISTFIIRREQIQQIKNWLLSRRREGDAQTNISTFVATCACVWVSLTRAKEEANNTNNNMAPHSYFVFAVDARTRLQPQIPSTYFGNCLTMGFTEVPRSALMAEDGVLMASEAIVREIEVLQEGALRRAGEWINRYASWAAAGVLSVAGSPKFGVYEIDFGWGRPRKVEVISIRGGGSMSLAESRKDKGGVEIGFVLPQPEMEEFQCQFANVLKSITDGKLGV